MCPYTVDLGMYPKCNRGHHQVFFQDLVDLLWDAVREYRGEVDITSVVPDRVELWVDLQHLGGEI